MWAPTRIRSLVAQSKPFIDRSTLWHPPAYLLAVAVMALGPGLALAGETAQTKMSLARPTPEQRAFQELEVNGQWTALKPANRFSKVPPPFNPNPGFETIGHKKTDRVEPVVTNRLRFRCLKAVAEPVQLRRLAVFDCSSR